jgi:hypothetical protein
MAVNLGIKTTKGHPGNPITLPFASFDDVLRAIVKAGPAEKEARKPKKSESLSRKKPKPQ